jgi:ferric-dicitrate binding protein FerR (iron transport regulator)
MTELSGAPSARSLAAFLSGECSASESAEVIRWAQSTPECAAHLEALRAIWEEGGRAKSAGVGSWSADATWSAIASRLGDDERPSLRLVVPARRRPAPALVVARRRNWAGWVAAAACAVLVAGVWTDQQASRERASRLPPVQEAVREYRTGRGQRASGTLPDGSAFQLGPLSVLRVPASYGTRERTLDLEGDGYFNVIHDARHPFAVRTARTTIRDIGTRFVVRARSSEQKVEVAVAEGEVVIGPPARRHAAHDLVRPIADADGMLVGAGQAARMDEKGEITLLPPTSVATRLAWTRGEFVFDHVPVHEVLAELSRWYGYEFVLADKSMESIKLTTVLRGETLLEARVLLETALDVRTRVDRDTVTLMQHGTHARSTP